MPDVRESEVSRLPRTRRFPLVAAALIALFALVAVACGDDGGSDANSQSPTTTAATTAGSTTATTKAPVQGGSLTFGEWRAFAGWDPIVSASTYGTGGGIEMAALYDTLLTVNPTTGAFEPRMAQSISSNADSTLWTLKLKPNIKFSDGTELNADAVKFNVDRHNSATSKSASKALLTSFLDSLRVVDSLTLEFKLKTAWTGLPLLLTRELGMIASPAAVQKAGANFHASPGDAGAGPFLLTSFKAGESITMARNPNYWGGAPYLDTLKFVLIPGGDSATYDALKVNTVQAAYVRDPVTIGQAKSDKTPALTVQLSPGGIAAHMNSGTVVTCAGGLPAASCAGKPDGTNVPIKTATSDLRVRKAVAAAINPATINDRVFSGKANTTTEPFPSPLLFSPGVKGPSYDPDMAKKLVTEAKAAGWDGKIRVLAATDPVNSALGLALSTMLQAVGMTVELQNDKDITAIVNQVLVNKDFDLVSWSYSVTDDPASDYVQFVRNWTGAAPYYGYTTPELTAAIDTLRIASTPDQQRASFKAISEIFVRDVPYLSLALLEEQVIYSSKVNGLTRAPQGRVYLDKVWLTQ